MVTKAYVLVETEAALTQEAVEEVRRIQGVKAAESVTGPYDIVVTVEVDKIDTMALVLRQIRSASGVTKTITLLKLG
jgi:uncharacterized protein with GYD domain